VVLDVPAEDVADADVFQVMGFGQELGLGAFPLPRTPMMMYLRIPVSCPRALELDVVSRVSFSLAAATTALRLPQLQGSRHLMDIKFLREVDGDGLERWEPVMKAGFPLPAGEVSRVFDALDVVPPPLTRAAYTLGQFLTDLVEPSSVRAVRVHKRRQHYTLANCMAEVADLEVDGRVARTIAIESEDSAAVIAAVRGVGLDGHSNTSYPRGLAALATRASRYAVIDVGTNSVKFHVGERDADGRWRTIVDRAEITRLGEGLGDHGAISAEPLERTVAAIAGMVEEARRHQVQATAAVGTAGLRIARNRDEVIAAIRTRTGVTVEVISGEEESRLAYLAARAGLGATEGSLVVFGAIHRAIRARRRGGTRGVGRCPGSDRRRPGPHRWPPDALVAMGGAVTNMTAVRLEMATYNPDRVQGAVLDRAELDRQTKLDRSRDAEARREIVGLQPKRADVILAGACIVRTVRTS
jgi:exopolyphosphatase/guanosine-5'-triphosphate,3'-diphosphate pyrophosphatase